MALKKNATYNKKNININGGKSPLHIAVEQIYYGPETWKATAPTQLHSHQKELEE